MSLLTDQSQLLFLIVICTILWSAESIIPLYNQTEGRVRHAIPNIGLALLLIITNLGLSTGLAYVQTFTSDSHLGLFEILRLPSWAQLILGIVALDLFAYFAHVLLHKSWFGWQFHRVHHSENVVDVTTAFRQHPGETIWRVFCRYLAVVVFALPLWVVVIYLILSTAHAQFEHANLRLPNVIDSVLRRLVVTPDMHKVHHSRIQIETDSNYGNIFSLWDKLFRTYTPGIDFNTLRFGLDGFDDKNRQTFTALLYSPFR